MNRGETMQIISGLFNSITGRFVLVVLLLMACLWVNDSRGQAEGGSAAKIQLQFKVPIIPEQMWVFRKNDGLDPPEEGVIFWIGRNREGEGRFLTVTSEKVLVENTFQQLLTQNMKADDPRLLYFGSTYPRNSFFHRIDLDGDGSDEVLLTSTGGIADNAFLTIFKVTSAGVRQIYKDGSCFSLRIIDIDNDGTYELANAGFEWVAQENVPGPKEFTIYSLNQGIYVRTKTMTAEEFTGLEGRFSKQGRLNAPVTLEKRPVFTLYPAEKQSHLLESK